MMKRFKNYKFYEIYLWERPKVQALKANSGKQHPPQRKPTYTASQMYEKDRRETCLSTTSRGYQRVTTRRRNSLDRGK